MTIALFTFFLLILILAVIGMYVSGIISQIK